MHIRELGKHESLDIPEFPVIISVYNVIVCIGVVDLRKLLLCALNLTEILFVFFWVWNLHFVFTSVDCMEHKLRVLRVYLDR
jgi:hypothetical protein